MSAIASFIRVQTSSLPEIREAAVPKKAFFGGLKDTFDDTLKRKGKDVARYQWSGYVLATLLVCLEEQQIDLMKSEHDALSLYLSEKLQATCFILTNAHKKFLDQLSPELFSEDALRDYYNEFNASNESDIGGAMLDGIRTFRESLESVDEKSVVLLLIR